MCTAGGSDSRARHSETAEGGRGISPWSLALLTIPRNSSNHGEIPSRCTGTPDDLSGPYPPRRQARHTWPCRWTQADSAKVALGYVGRERQIRSFGTLTDSCFVSFSADEPKLIIRRNPSVRYVYKRGNSNADGSGGLFSGGQVMARTACSEKRLPWVYYGAMALSLVLGALISISALA